VKRGRVKCQSPSQLYSQTINSDWSQQSPPVPGVKSTNTSPKHQITSMPVSVLTANTRKRNFSSEPIVESTYAGDHIKSNQLYNKDVITADTSHQQGTLDDLESISNHLPIENTTLTLESSNVNSNENSAVTYQQTYIKPLNDTLEDQVTQITETYEQWPNSDPSIQEKKWNAEFNEVLQTVFEESKENPKDQMDWVQDNNSKIVIPDNVHKDSMDWNADSIIQSSDITSENVPKDTTMEWASNTNKGEKVVTNTESVMESPVNITYLVPSGNENTLNQEILNSLKPVPITPASSADVNNQNSPTNTVQVYQESVNTPQPQETQSQLNQQISLPELSKSSVEFLSENQTISNVQQQFNQFTASVTPISPIPQYSPETNKSTTYKSTSSPIEISSEETEKTKYDQTPTTNLSLFDDSVQIQGDPLLSETSSVIGVQKDIENATFSDVVYESEIPKDQQWASQPASEWNYNSSA